MKHKYVFISYSSAGKSILEGYDIPCWITPHDIIQATRECSLMVLIYSENSSSSSQVASEIDKAFSHGKIINTFMVDSTSMNNDFNYYLSCKHWLVASPAYKQMLMPLAEAVATKIRVEFQRPHPSLELRQRVGKHPIARTYPQPVINTKRPWREWRATGSVRSNSTTEWQLLLLLSVGAYVLEWASPVREDRGRRVLKRY